MIIIKMLEQSRQVINSSLQLYYIIITRSQYGYMTHIEALYLPSLMVDLLNHLPADVHRRQHQ